MLVIVIIALALSLVAIAVGIILIFRISALFGELGDFEKDVNNDIAGLKQAVKEMEKQEVTVEGLPGFSYDEKTNTVTIDGNLMVEGWVASGGIKKEE